MIRIFTGTCIYIEKSLFKRADILKEYRLPERYKNVKFVITTKGNRVCTVFDYRDILLKREFMENTILPSKTTFEEARQYFQSVENLFSGECVGVLKENGSLDYILEYWNNVHFIEKDREPHFFAFESYDFGYEEEQINRLLQLSDTVVFECMEEYSIHIANILLKINQTGRRIKLYSLDKNSSRFFKHEEMTVLSNLSLLNEERNYNFILSGRYSDTPYKNTERRTCYKSLEIMTRLYGTKIVSEIKPDTNKSFVIIEDEYLKNGLVDLMKHNMLEAMIQEKEGKIPYVNIIYNNVYKEVSGENVWEHYFKPVNSYTLDQIYASGNYVRISRPLMVMGREQQSEMRRVGIGWNRIDHIKKIEWKKEIVAYCKSQLPQPFLEKKKILGIICRGTDMRKFNAKSIKNLGVEEMMERTSDELQRECYDYIYLATEDATIYRKFVTRFGEQILTSDQERFDLEKQQQYVNSWIATIPRKNGGYEYGLDYLSVIYCVSQCDSLVASMASGAYLAAMAMNNNRYKRVIV